MACCWRGIEGCQQPVPGLGILHACGRPSLTQLWAQMGAALMWNILEGHELPEYGELPSAGKSGSGTEVEMSCPEMVVEEEASWSPLGIRGCPQEGPRSARIPHSHWHG